MPAPPAALRSSEAWELKSRAENLRGLLRPGLVRAANPPLLALEMRDLGPVAAEAHPIKPGLQMRHRPPSHRPQEYAAALIAWLERYSTEGNTQDEGNTQEGTMNRIRCAGIAAALAALLIGPSSW